MTIVQVEYLRVCALWDKYIEDPKQSENIDLVNSMIDAEDNIINWIVTRSKELQRYNMTLEKMECMAANDNEEFRELVLSFTE